MKISLLRLAVLALLATALAPACANAPATAADSASAPADSGATPADTAATPADTAETSAPTDAIALDAVAPDTDKLQPDTAAPETAPADAAAETAAAPDAAEVAATPQCTTVADCPAPAACQIALCNAKGLCSYAPSADGSACEDGNACTGGSTCTAGTCANGKAIVCDDENPCTSDKCNPLAGCINLPVAASTACDDGDACTSGDSCQNGKCQSGTGICQCASNQDCGKYEDGNFCNGTLYCDKSAGAPFTCKLNPATIVACDGSQDGQCQKNQCVPATGACVLSVAPTNTQCNDGQPCTAGDYCESGQCKGGVNVCFCKADSDCASQEDGDLCNGTLFCNKAKAACELNPVTVVHCQTVNDSYCQQNLCNPKEGKCHLVGVHEGKACDDGNACTPNESCQQGACTTATNTCQCQKDADCAAKEDGNLCNGTLYCDLKSNQCAVNPATVVKCNTDDDPPCLKDVCDGKTGQCQALALPKDGTLCDDGNACTAVDVCQNGQCTGLANVCECQKDSDCAAKEDGDLCNGTLYCQKSSGKCAVNPATVVECPSAFDSYCAANQCNPKTGVCSIGPSHQGNQCSGDNACSAGGWCNLGACELDGTSACACQQDSDCQKFEDGNLCNGTLYCNKNGKQPECLVNPATVVVCPSGADTACSKSQCNPQSGQCKPAEASGPCDDGNACTVGDGCAGGTCKAGLPKACDDGNACTADTCLAGFGCVSLPLPASACDDGSSCTADSCNPALGCAHAAIAGACEDSNPCTDDGCGKSGCMHEPNSAPCSDGNACTAGDACKNGNCAYAKPSDCGDGNPCTDDGCDPKAGCVSLPNAATCDDGNACTVKDACKLGACAGGIGSCDDGNLCTDDSCGGGSCSHKNNAAACTDNNNCTTGDACSNGACAGKGVVDCSDGNLCTNDNCDLAAGCVHLANAVTCSDGNACTSGDVCTAGQCAGLTANCDDSNACTNDSCDPKSGCAHAANTLGCSDGNACTVGDACAGGSCMPGKAKDCDDANVCTSDACLASTGQCQNTDTSSTCDDKEKCTDDVCHSKLGCLHTANKLPCDDGNACTSGDNCVNGGCLSGPALDCDDKNGCTSDSCDKAKGCAYVFSTAACDDGIGCTSNDVCSNGKCAGKSTCDDKDGCTLDECNLQTLQCKHTPVSNQGPCDDGNLCTAKEFCDNGSCSSLTPTDCDDKNACTDDNCEKSVGCKHTPNSAPCDNGECVIGTQCVGGTCVSGKNPKLWQSGFDLVANYHDRAYVGIGTGSGYLVAGTRSIQDNESTDLWIAALNGDGSLKSAGKIPQVGPSRPAALFDKGDGTYLMYGCAAKDSFSASGPGFWHLDATGKVLDSKMTATPGQGTEDMIFGACQLTGSNAALKGIVGRRIVANSAYQSDTIFGLADGNGALFTNAMVARSEAGAQEARACVPFDKANSVLSIGSSNVAGGAGGVDVQLVAWSTDLGNWTSALAGTSSDDWGNAAALSSDGFVWAAGGTAGGGTGGDAFAAKFDYNGSNFVVVWKKSWGGAQKDEVLQLLPAPEGGAYAIGYSTVQNIAQTAIWRLSKDGRIEWSKIGNATVATSFSGGRLLGDGSALLMGTTKVNGNQDFWVAAVDFMGNATCSESGGCFAFGNCSDNDACSDDVCSSGKGCSHVANPDTCNDGNVCTEKDACTNGKCTGASVVCDDKNPCSTDFCNPEQGCQVEWLPAGFACGNGKKCDGLGTCQ